MSKEQGNLIKKHKKKTVHHDYYHNIIINTHIMTQVSGFAINNSFVELFFVHNDKRLNTYNNYCI